MPQTKENRILKQFRAEMDKRKNAFGNEGLYWKMTREEYKKACSDAYNEVILLLATQWKMKCREIKDAINLAKKNPRKYDSRCLKHCHTEPL